MAKEVAELTARFPAMPARFQDHGASDDDGGGGLSERRMLREVSEDFCKAFDQTVGWADQMYLLLVAGPAFQRWKDAINSA